MAGGMAHVLKTVTVRNKLDATVENVKVVYAQSDKSTSLVSYAFDWSTVDVESDAHVISKKQVLIGSIEKCQEVSVDDDIPFAKTRGYWQVYFQYNNCKYKIDKNNAMMNPFPQDDGKYVEITIRRESDNIRLDFVMDSGNAYFYAMAWK